MHADLFPDNVLFARGKLTGLIDFYFACTDLLAYDIAVCLNAWCFDEDAQYQPAIGGALLDGYQSVRALDAAELAALPGLCRGAALRFLLTRSVDWVEPQSGALVAPKDPTEFVRRLNFHQCVTDPAIYSKV